MDPARLDHEILHRPGPASRLLVLLHGYGEPIGELTDRLPLIDPEGRFLAVAPQAPFERKGLAIWHRAMHAREEAEAQFRASIAALDAHLGEVAEATGLPAAEAIVGGFSQGGGLALALLMGADTTNRPAAGFGICSFPPHLDGFRVSRAATAGTPYLLSSARRDHFAPIESSRQGAVTLTHLGMELTYVEADTEHVMTDDAARAIGSWLDGLDGGVPPTGDRHLLAASTARMTYLEQMWELVA
jgi:predicted esterase